MPRKVRVALAGLGSVSQRGILPHLAQPDALERVELVACCDVVPDRARETARVFGWAEHYADYDEMLARAKSDLKPEVARFAEQRRRIDLLRLGRNGDQELRQQRIEQSLLAGPQLLAAAAAVEDDEFGGLGAVGALQVPELGVAARLLPWLDVGVSYRGGFRLVIDQSFVDALAERYGVASAPSNVDAVSSSDVLVLTVKPQDMESLLSEIREHVTERHLVVSFAAGIRTSFVEKHLPDGIPVVRVMSNVAVLVD